MYGACFVISIVSGKTDGTWTTSSFFILKNFVLMKELEKVNM